MITFLLILWGPGRGVIYLQVYTALPYIMTVIMPWSLLFPLYQDETTNFILTGKKLCNGSFIMNNSATVYWHTYSIQFYFNSSTYLPDTKGMWIVRCYRNQHLSTYLLKLTNWGKYLYFEIEIGVKEKNRFKKTHTLTHTLGLLFIVPYQR